MTHLDDGALQAHLDGETRGSEAKRLRDHLEGCAPCAARLEGLREERERASRAVALLDVPAPVDAARDELRRKLSERSTGTGARAPAWMAVSRRALARAAILLLLVAGVAADRLPGSPVEGWIGELVGQVRSALVDSPDDAADADPDAAPDAAVADAESGVRVSAAGGRVRVVLTGVAPGSRIDVRLVDGTEAGVRGSGGGRYRTAPGLVEVVDPGSAVTVEIPREVASATVEVDGRVYLRKDGGRLEVRGPATDSTEAELRFRTPGGDGDAPLD